MSTWDSIKNFLTAPFGGIGGSGGGYLHDLANSLEGNPDQVSASLQQLANQAYGQGQQVKNFLLGREGNAEQYYRPMQQMFGQMYGTGGIMPAKAPQAPGVPLKPGGSSGSY